MVRGTVQSVRTPAELRAAVVRDVLARKGVVLPPKTIQVKLPPLLPKQREVVEHPARFTVLAAGRRWGKSRLGCVLCLKVALEGGLAWWVAPSYPIASIGWREIKHLVRQIPGAQIHEGERLADLPGGGAIQVKSADNPDSLRGEGLDFVTLDECAFMREEAWTEALRPALSDRRGGALFISTPKGRNWFWRIWQRAQDRRAADWHAWRFPTSANPLIDSAEIEAAKANLPERVFEQEYMAAFIDDAGGVFRRVSDAATAAPQDKALAGHEYALGVDWAKTTDYTVIAVVDLTERALVAMDRFNRIDYALQIKRLHVLYDQFRPRQIIPELNSMGAPLAEQLERDGLPIFPFTTTAASKAEAIDALALAFEQEQIRIIPDPVLISELQAYEAKRLPSGLLRYEAPSGVHDDCVMALALAWTAAREGPASRDFVMI